MWPLRHVGKGAEVFAKPLYDTREPTLAQAARRSFYRKKCNLHPKFHTAMMWARPKNSGALFFGDRELRLQVFSSTQCVHLTEPLFPYHDVGGFDEQVRVRVRLRSVVDAVVGPQHLLHPVGEVPAAAPHSVRRRDVPPHAQLPFWEDR